MSVLFISDFYAGFSGEIKSITKKNLVKKYRSEKYSRIKYYIILDDGGFIWPGNLVQNLMNYNTLARRNFPVFNVFGNQNPIHKFFLMLKIIADTNIYIKLQKYYIR
jgi:hypothetical protein